jgi:diguanylate cyclase (GGDEF)-like protein
MMKHWEYQPNYVIFICGIIGELIISFLDYLVKIDLSFSPFYLLPILFVTWLDKRRSGFILSLIGSLGALVADMSVISNPLIPYWRFLVQLGFYILIVYLLSYSKSEAHKNQQLSRIDQTTGVYNRRFFLFLAQREINRLQRFNRPVTIMSIEINSLQNFNQNWGFHQGDKLLHTVANTIIDNIRLTDIVARLGDDQFVILFPESDYQAAQIPINRIREKLLTVLESSPESATFSMGAVTFPHQILSVQQMIEQADSLLATAKKKGKNQLQHQLIDELPTWS